MRVGGNFFFDPRPGDPSSDLLLIAGGVGINPLFSIVRHVADISSDLPNKYTGKTVLLFSAKNIDELLFKVQSFVHADFTTVKYVNVYTHAAPGN